RDRTADQSGQGKSIWPAQCVDNFNGLSARLRAAEIVDLRWDQVDLGRNAALHVRRVKSGTPATHPLQGDEMRAGTATRQPVCVHQRTGLARAVLEVAVITIRF